MFERDWFRVVDRAPTDVIRVRYWDKAGTEGAGAYTAGVRLALDMRTLIVYVEDVVRGQWSSHKRNKIIRQTAELDGHDTAVWIEQEPGSGGKESAEISVKQLIGYDVHIERVTGDKVTRAKPFSDQAEAGNVMLVRGTWNTQWLDEICPFPNGAYKDQVDASSGAFNKLALLIGEDVEDITDLL
jgi:predicted phage terminase large subunit-like protein